MKIALITDTHWGVRGSSENFLEYFRKWYCDYFFPYLEANGINTIFHGGDVFDNRRNVNVKVYDYFVKYFINEAKQRGNNIHGIVGNHDCYNKSDNNIALVERLSTHLKDQSPVFHFASEPYTFEIDNFKIDFIPWINEDNYERIMHFVHASDSDYCLGHFEFSGFTMYKNSVAVEGMDSTLFKKYKRVYSGHFHEPSAAANVMYLGSPYDTTWQDFGQPRGFSIIDTDKPDSIEYIRTKSTLFTELNFSQDLKINPEDYDDKFVRINVNEIKDDDRKKHNKTLDKFVKDIELHAHDVKIIDNTIKMVKKDSVDETALLQDTTTVFNEYIKQNVDEKLQSAVLRFMTNLYEEAQGLHD